MPEPGVQRKLAAIVAADVTGYSRLMGNDETGTAKALRGHVEALRPIIARYGGRIVDTAGDGLLLEFPSIVAAVECAVAAQKLMAERNADAPQDRRMLYRVGINLGDVIVEGERILGDGVNVAARLESIATPGGICLSDAAYQQVRGKVAVDFADMGEQRLKNIARPIRAFSVVLDTAIPEKSPLFEDRSIPRLSFLVLPFVSLSDSRDDEYFADGITDDLITELSQWTDMFVIARSSAFAYKGKNVDAKSVGRDLRVAYVLEGSVRRSNNRVRLTVQLIETASGGHIWADRFDRDVAELFELQDEITRRIALALHYKIVDMESRRARDRRSNNPDARDLVTRGDAATYKPTSKTTMAEARGYYERALQVDSQSVRAWAGLAVTHIADVLARWSEAPAEQLRAAEEAAAKAMECDPMRPEAHLARAGLLFAQRKLEAALEEYATVIELAPGWAVAYGRMGILNALLGRPAETIPLVQRAIRLSPRDPNLGEWYLDIGIASFMMDQLGEAIRCLRRSTEANPNFAVTYLTLAAACSLDGRDEEARAALSEYLRRVPMMTISKLRASPSPFSTHPAYLAWRERVYDGLCKAGLPEE
jgi:TolB-like protein/class 3 adenylate cyclase/Tfp pilus assembly protein PilF